MHPVKDSRSAADVAPPPTPGGPCRERNSLPGVGATLWTSGVDRVDLMTSKPLTESEMAKGQQKSSREKKKPKKKAEEGLKQESSYKQNFGKK